MKVEAIDHLHFCVPDLGRAQALLGAFAGGECTPAYGGDDAWWNCRVVYNSVGLEIMQPIRDGERIVGTKDSRRKGVIAVAFRVDGLDARIPQAEALGLRLLSRSGSEEAGFGKWIEQAQFDPEQTFGVMVELAERQRPDDPLLSPFPDPIDRIELYVRDLPRAARLFSDLTGAGFAPPLIDAGLQALGTTNALGLRLLQPLSEAGEVGRRITAAGEGVHAIVFAVDDLERGIATAQAAGLRLLARGGGPDDRPEAEFDAADSWGMTIKLTERRRG